MSHRTALGFLLVALAMGPVAPSVLPEAGAAKAPDVRQPLAVVGDDTLAIADLDAELSATFSAAKGRSDVPRPNPEAALKRLIQNRLFEQEGYRIGAEKLPAVQNQVKDFIRLRSVKALLDSVSAPKRGTPAVSPDSPVGKTNTIRRYSHILVKEEELARTLRDSLSLGTPFEELAKRHSTDNTAAKGGDLDWAAAGAYVDEFEAAARPLSRHEIAGPIKTKFGWHLITLTDTKTDTLKSETMAQALVAGRERQRRDKAVLAYVASLKQKYGVTTNDSLLASLDYGSADPKVQQKLQSSEEVLALGPTGRLTVRGLTRNIRFKYFHGLNGRPDAAGIRDRMFDEWLTEALLSHEAQALGFDTHAGVLGQARREERRLVREEVLGNVLAFEFKPDSGEIRSYYMAHLTEFTPKPRVKVRSVLISDEQAALRFREGLNAGARFKWLVSQTPEVMDTPPPIPVDWVDPGPIGLGDTPVAVGIALGPLTLPNGWAVAEVAAVEKAEPSPLDKCRDQVVRAMRNEHVREAIENAIAKLESATSITILDGAPAAVADRIDGWFSSRTEGGRP